MQLSLEGGGGGGGGEGGRTIFQCHSPPTLFLIILYEPQSDQGLMPGSTIQVRSIRWTGVYHMYKEKEKFGDMHFH